jgi:hypothetical protein
LVDFRQFSPCPPAECHGVDGHMRYRHVLLEPVDICPFSHTGMVCYSGLFPAGQGMVRGEEWWEKVSGTELGNNVEENAPA